MNVIYEDGLRIPIKLWLNDIEDGALEQAKNLARLPFAFKWVSIMPDAHQGYGMPIGGVLATRQVVIPNAVGVDIGCGVRAVRSSLTDFPDGTKDVKAIIGRIREEIPVGFAHRTRALPWTGFDAMPNVPVVEEQAKSARLQLGTLGGGNHFIEIQKGSDGHIWLMLHSGSRNFGLQIAKEYHRIAQELCERWFSDIPHPDLAFLPIDSLEGAQYLSAMNFALDFARENRRAMMWIIKDIVSDWGSRDITFGDDIDVHHNYACLEYHFGHNVMVHRKGAISARRGQPGIIPGSQGTKSYIVGGLGSPDSFTSCSHGAGRKIGRKEAQRALSLDDEKYKLDAQGIVHSIRNVSDLDEAPGAYKDIDAVMENQKDLVDIVVELAPLGVVKA